MISEDHRSKRRATKKGRMILVHRDVNTYDADHDTSSDKDKCVGIQKSFQPLDGSVARAPRPTRGRSEALQA